MACIPDIPLAIRETIQRRAHWNKLGEDEFIRGTRMMTAKDNCENVPESTKSVQKEGQSNYRLVKTDPDYMRSPYEMDDNTCNGFVENGDLCLSIMTCRTGVTNTLLNPREPHKSTSEPNLSRFYGNICRPSRRITDSRKSKTRNQSCNDFSVRPETSLSIVSLHCLRNADTLSTPQHPDLGPSNLGNNDRPTNRRNGYHGNGFRVNGCHSKTNGCQGSKLSTTCDVEGSRAHISKLYSRNGHPGKMTSRTKSVSSGNDDEVGKEKLTDGLVCLSITGLKSSDELGRKSNTIRE